ncbi:hypothetical protein DP107_13500 [Haloglomus irregulare]|jgi:hypothetical protein|uniref:Uncharacterized protein n=1 Tax=Haloglomus irregulare TaxID=2234134 RepID=A0A554MXY2_9EURY|nr:hypothetical protein [Haloglomus irregulare]TSD09998.1 hypothetical protein DP107_13500 [Haloglomus irregulare]
MALRPDHDRIGWLHAVRGSQVPAVLAGGGEPLDAADLHQVRSTLRGGTIGAAVAADGLAVLLFVGETLMGTVALGAGVACALAFLVGYAVQVRAVARCVRTLPVGVPPVAATTLPAGAALGVLSALAVVVPFGVARTLLLLGVGVGAAALATGVALGVACQRAALRQTRRPEPGTTPQSGSPAAND